MGKTLVSASSLGMKENTKKERGCKSRRSYCSSCKRSRNFGSSVRPRRVIYIMEEFKQLADAAREGGLKF
jgi:hypothetical protein